MAIKYISELPESASRDGYRLTITRNLLYQVTGGSHPSEILSDSHIPAYSMAHPSKSGYFVKSVDEPRQTSGKSYDGAYSVAINYIVASLLSSDLSVIGGEEKPWEQSILDISYDSIDVVVPQQFYYMPDDKQFAPSGIMQHPATQEPIISDTRETHALINIRYALRSFRYEWIRRYRGTTNASAICIAGVTFPAYSAVITKLGAAKKTFTSGSGKASSYWEINMQIEDFARPTDEKQVALQGYLAIFEEKIANIQLKEGEFGSFDQTNTGLNISTPRWVAQIGAVLPAGEQLTDENRNSYYLTVPDVYWTDWATLSIPSTEV